MDLYVLTSTPILPAHVSSTQNSLQGALKPDSVSDLPKRPSASTSKSPDRTTTPSVVVPLDQDMQMQQQLADYNRSITLIIWYKPDTEPIRLQHTNPTFPYFQLLQLASLASDLGLAPGAYIDAYEPQSGKWEQHSISTVRLVASQQRLLYKTRRTLLEGLSERQCPGLLEEVQVQARLRPKLEAQTSNVQLTRPLPDAHQAGPPQKVHIPNSYYKPRLAAPAQPQAAPEPSLGPIPAGTYAYQQLFYPTPQSQVPSTSSLPAPAPIPDDPANLSTTSTSAPPIPISVPTTTPIPIPHHPHPPLKRWPNDYTVSEVTAGFTAMEALIRSRSPSSPPMTQRTAFERVFGSRYVKSTVCRHRGVWRKAAGPVREQYERMGGDEKACWGEFVRRIEGRGGKGLGDGGVGQVYPGLQGVGMEEKAVVVVVPVEEPVMASLQNPG